MRYEILPPNFQLEENLKRGLDIPLFVAKMLINRGIFDIKEAIKFIKPELNNLHDPFLMKGIREGVERIKRAIQSKESICVFGDYDTDGISATALLVLTLQKLGARSKFYIPSRLKEGYGLKKDSIKKLSEEGIDLIITVDCGITSIEEIGFAHALGMDVIVTDHHRPLAMLPPAKVIINPRQIDCQYPFKELAGVGIAFKLCQALTGLKNEELLNSESHLDLVTLGTIADFMPLQDENRIIVKYGLKNFTNINRIGLRALSEVSGVNLNKIDADHIGYRFAPRLNAAGRMGDAKKGLNLLLTKNFTEARILASMLEEDNKSRQIVQREVFQEVRNLVNSLDLKNEGLIVLSSKSWHRGVIGIVASRLTDEYNCPVIIISIEDGVGYASCRSPEWINIMSILDKVSNLFSSYGGHKYAAGFTIEEEKIEEFKEKVKSAILKLPYNKFSSPEFTVEGEVDPTEIPVREFEKWMDVFSPFGVKNSLPIFLSRNMVVVESPMVTPGNHLKLVLEGRKGRFRAIGFGSGEIAGKLEKGDFVDIFFNPVFDRKNDFSINLVGLEF